MGKYFSFMVTTFFWIITPISPSVYASFSPHAGFERFSSDHPEMVNFFEVRKHALSLIDQSFKSDRFSEDQKRAIRTAKEKLLFSHIYFSVNPFNSSCQNRRAYVDKRIKDTIFICGPMRRELEKPLTDAITEEFAQVLVHEAMHLIGGNECTATRVELTVMDSTLGRADTSSMEAYADECGGFAEFEHLKKKSNSTVARSNLRPNTRGKQRGATGSSQ